LNNYRIEDHRYVIETFSAESSSYPSFADRGMAQLYTKAELKKEKAELNEFIEHYVKEAKKRES